MNVNHLISNYKYGKPVLTGSGLDGEFDAKAVDCPNVFSHNGKFYMTYLGFDSIGYQTGLAVSDNLIDWEKKGVILKRDSHMQWDKVGMAGVTVLTDKDLYGGNKLKKYKEKYWMIYHAYPKEGYEGGSAEMGLAWTEDEELLDWHFYGEPVFSWKDGADWEKGGLYKPDLVEHNGKFYMFYNAKGKETGYWLEQIGMAVSEDLVNWERVFDKPVLPVDRFSWDSVYASDPQVFYDSREEQWVMYYYGYGNLNACNGIAVSKDLFTWKKFPCPILTPGRDGTIDSRHAHKPYVIFHNNVLYHFYCAVRPYQNGDLTNFNGFFRSITVAASKPWKEKK